MGIVIDHIFSFGGRKVSFGGRCVEVTIKNLDHSSTFSPYSTLSRKLFDGDPISFSIGSSGGVVIP